MAKELAGSLSKNDKQGVEARPDYRGSCMIGGVEYWLSGWIKDGESGKWLSLSFKPKEEKKEAKQDSGRITDMESDPLPF